jgi:hypothetical protein
MSLLPVVLRARAFRLYTQGGGRLVDLWQAGGRAILGHNPAGALRELKNYAGRGLFAPLPHPQERRLARALSRLLPGRAFRFYPDQFSLRSALEAADFPWPGPFPDPALPGEALSGESPPAAYPAGGPALWRPFLETSAGDPPDSGARPLLVPLLPWPLAPWVLALDPALEGRFPPSGPISPALLAAAARSVYDLIALGPQGGRPVFPRLNRVLYASGKGTPASPWRRRGVYLYYPPLQAPQGIGPSPGWEALFRRFLEAGFLIPPGPGEPLILPQTLSQGEETKLAALLLR